MIVHSWQLWDLTKKSDNIGNFRAIHKVKRGGRFMLTTNIDVSDGLTNECNRYNYRYNSWGK